MSKYEVNTILSMWAQDKLTVEQAVGQILQHLQALLGRVGQLEKQVDQWRRQEERETAVSGVAKLVVVPEPMLILQAKEADVSEPAATLPEPDQETMADEAENQKALANGGMEDKMGSGQEGNQPQLNG